ncbi:hypothetical protein LSH36_669g02013 [Paralvinella palmiformis]|uniref:Uncharacterized protein n=1 Tax=Paralvinella palmiformis TaxID=53620 RepID=A0AAD9J3S5_9ANNE|nr:hypothetical protein LSH36_669g02013 [Paralvinella palmiformis]
MNMTIEWEEFVDVIGVDDGQFVDEHWMTFYDTCFSCSIHYDAVMRVVTLEGASIVTSAQTTEASRRSVLTTPI